MQNPELFGVVLRGCGPFFTYLLGVQVRSKVWRRDLAFPADSHNPQIAAPKLCL